MKAELSKMVEVREVSIKLRLVSCDGGYSLPICLELIGMSMKACCSDRFCLIDAIWKKFEGPVEGECPVSTGQRR